MPEINQGPEDPLELNRFNAYLANERTFLAWIRTSVGIMAFGFVVEKFGLFLKQLAFALAKSHLTGEIRFPESSETSIFGIFLVTLGALIGVLAFIKYKNVERQIKEGKYRSSLLLEFMLTLSILAVGIFLIIYLIHTI